MYNIESNKINPKLPKSAVNIHPIVHRFPQCIPTKLCQLSTLAKCQWPKASRNIFTFTQPHLHLKMQKVTHSWPLLENRHPPSVYSRKNLHCIFYPMQLSGRQNSLFSRRHHPRRLPGPASQPIHKFKRLRPQLTAPKSPPRQFARIIEFISQMLLHERLAGGSGTEFFHLPPTDDDGRLLFQLFSK